MFPLQKQAVSKVPTWEGRRNTNTSARSGYISDFWDAFAENMAASLRSAGPAFLPGPLQDGRRRGDGNYLEMQEVTKMYKPGHSHPQCRG